MKTASALTPLLLAALLAAPGAAAPESRPAPSAGASGPRAVLNLLKSRKITLDFDEPVSLETFVAYVRAASGLNVVVAKHRIERDGGNVEGIGISLKVKDVTLASALELALGPLDLGMRIQGNVLVITSKRDARGKPALKIYNVAHLLVPIRDFPGQDMNLYPSGYEPPEPPEAEVVQTYESSEELAELVRNFTGKDTWEDEGVTITVFRRHLFVRTYPSVHAEIEELLARLPH